MFFRKKKSAEESIDLTKIAALLIHAAKIDQNYSLEEEKIIEKAILKIGAKEDEIKRIRSDAKKIEDNSNQILEFTKEVKNMDDKNKIKIIETLWKIIYSNDSADMYETNLMSRLAGLLYIDSKTMGDLKEKVKREITK